MSDVPDHPGAPDPFEGLPPELRQMLEQLAGPEALDQLREQLSGLLGGGDLGDLGGDLGGLGAMLGGLGLPGAPGTPGAPGAGGPGLGFTAPLAGLGGLAGGGGLGGLFGGPGAAPSGPVDWNLASRVALQVAADGDRGPTPEEEARARDVLQLAEHWLDASALPASPDAGRLVVASRQTWVNAALTALRPFVEPVSRAAADALIDLAREQFDGLEQEGGLAAVPGLEHLPPEITAMAAQLFGSDPGAMLRPACAAMSGLQAGQVVGRLARQLLGQYELGIPTAPRAEAHHLAVNVAEVFAGYDIDPREADLVLALHEAAHRRLYHAVPWLEAHVQSLVARFAAGTTVDEARLRELSEEMMTGVDPEDPDSLRAAMERAAGFHLRPTEEQERVLARLQTVVCLVGAWARREVARAVEGRLPALPRIEEVLRRRRAVKGDGEELLTALLGLDIKPDDESVGERFVAAVEDALGPAGLHRALAHPENLPDADELADPARWLTRTADDVDVPDDLSALFGELGEAPREGTAEERRRERDGDPDDGTGDAGGSTDGGDTDDR